MDNPVYIVNDDGVLLHYGVKGMKWGIRRYQPYQKGDGQKGKGKFLGKVQKAMKSNSENKAKKRQQYHNKKFQKDITKRQNMYSSYYRASKAMGAKPETAMKVGRHLANAHKVVLFATTAPAAIAVADELSGRKITKGVGKAITTMNSPETKRIGKNIVQALNGNPVRYVDGSQMKNVINPAYDVIKRR